MKQNKEPHWTAINVDDMLYCVAANFVDLIRERLSSQGKTQADLAGLLGKTESRISQILNNPGNASLRTMIKCAKALGMKISVVAYIDNDERRGPIHPTVFLKSWKRVGRPHNNWEYKDRAKRKKSKKCTTAPNGSRRN